MQKDASYHESAIKYNADLAECAEALAKVLENEEVTRWARSVAKQHRFHEGRHKKALEKLVSLEAKVVNTEDGGEDRVIDDHHIVPAEVASTSIAEEQAEFAAAQQDTEV